MLSQKNQSPQPNIENLAALFPACMTEVQGKDGKLKKAVNFELLRQMLSDVVLEGDEAYEFTWVGKKAAIVETNRPIRKTLRLHSSPLKKSFSSLCKIHQKFYPPSLLASIFASTSNVESGYH